MKQEFEVMMRKVVVFCLCLLWTTIVNAETPKNIILFIGDGMGPAQVTAARTMKGQLAMEKFKIGGFVLTHSSNSYITDSAAGATAYATGYKTYNGAISVDPDTREPLQTILEFAEQLGKSTGLVATCSVTHATPACFAAHVKSRNEQQLIAEHIAKSGVDVLIGGGRGYFLPNGEKGSRRTDHKNLFKEMTGYTFANSENAFRTVGAPDRLIALLRSNHLHKAKNRNLSLAALTLKAIDILAKNSKGFFLMVEGSQIDWAGHGNKKEYLIGELLDFDAAIDVGYNFAADDGETLVLITADHETGGMALIDGSLERKKIKMQFETTHHTAVMVPVFAFGPGAENFGGIQQNTHIGKMMFNFWQ